MDANTVIQTLLGSLLTIQLGVIAYMLKRQGKHEDNFNDFKDELPTKYVTSQLFELHQKALDDCLREIREDYKETKSTTKRIHERIDSLAKASGK